MKTHLTQLGQREGEHVIALGKFNLLTKAKKDFFVVVFIVFYYMYEYEYMIPGRFYEDKSFLIFITNMCLLNDHLLCVLLVKRHMHFPFLLVKVQ